MPAPSDYPDFATDTNYTNGPDAGTATKIEPSAGELAEGHIREDAPSPQKMNWWQSIVGLWIRYFQDEKIPEIDGRLDGIDGDLDAQGTVNSAVNGALTALDGRVEDLEEFDTETPSTIYTSSTHSNLTNISAVSSTDAIIVIRRGNYVTAHAFFTVTNSVSGEKSFEFTLPYMLGDFAQQYHLTGSGCVYNAGGNYPAMVYAVTSSQRAKCEWFSTDTAGDVAVRLSFGYYIGVP